VTTPRLYLPQTLQEQGRYTLDAGHQRYLRNVLRLRRGDAVTLFDGSGWDYHAVIERMDDDGAAAVRIVGRTEIAAAPAGRITLAQALPKGAKMDGIVEKATEIGAVRIVPFHSVRSVPRWEDAKAAARVERWEKIAVEAARRCRRCDVPAIAPVLSFAGMLALAGSPPPAPRDGKTPGGGEERRQDAPDGGNEFPRGEPAPAVLSRQRRPAAAVPAGTRPEGNAPASPPAPRPGRIIFWEEGGRDIKALLRDGAAGPPPDCFVVVGPEGGFAAEEVAAAQAAGFAVASLGTRVLRVETASLVILTILQYERGMLSPR